MLAAAFAAGGAAPRPRAIPSAAKKIYQACTDCHSLDQNDVGPRHRGVYGRKAGSLPDYRYSDALKSAKIVWTEETLDKWLTDPQTFVPGVKMFFHLDNPQDRADVIAFLRDRRSSRGVRSEAGGPYPTAWASGRRARRVRGRRPRPRREVHSGRSVRTPVFRRAMDRATWPPRLTPASPRAAARFRAIVPPLLDDAYSAREMALPRRRRCSGHRAGGGGARAEGARDDRRRPSKAVVPRDRPQCGDHLDGAQPAQGLAFAGGLDDLDALAPADSDAAPDPEAS